MKVKNALQALVAFGFASTVAMADHHEGDTHHGKKVGDKVKCYGVAKAGKNDCGNKSGTHSCAGMAKKDYAKGEWKYVASKKKCSAMKAKVAKKMKNKKS